MTAALPYVRFTLHCRPGTEDEAARLILGLPVSGWQELPANAAGGRGASDLVFWLDGAALDEPSVDGVLERLNGLGRLEAAAESSDWERVWRRFHRPARIGRIYVRPPWAPPQPDAVDVLIDVGMAFGIGGHQTTRQCLRLLQEIPPGSLLDVGCGTGILSVAAAKLGFAPVYAVDNDEIATTATAANALLNDVRLDIAVADATDRAVPLPAADVLVGNVALRPLHALGERLSSGSACRPRDVVLAGLLRRQADEVLPAWPTYEVAARLDDAEWSALHLRLRTAATEAGAPAWPSPERSSAPAAGESAARSETGSP